MNNSRGSFRIPLYFLIPKYKNHKYKDSTYRKETVSKYVITEEKKNLKTLLMFLWMLLWIQRCSRCCCICMLTGAVTSRNMRNTSPCFTQCSWGLYFLEKLMIEGCPSSAERNQPLSFTDGDIIIPDTFSCIHVLQKSE